MLGQEDASVELVEEVCGLEAVHHRTLHFREVQSDPQIREPVIDRLQALEGRVIDLVHRGAHEDHVAQSAAVDHAILDQILEKPGIYEVEALVHAQGEDMRIGLDLAARYEAEWSRRVDRADLISTLLLHDIDKPLLYRRVGDEVAFTPLYKELPHGVIAAMLLKELAFPSAVINVVATHAVNAPFHGITPAAFILHYADMFATDRVHLDHSLSPFYQRMHPR